MMNNSEQQKMNLATGEGVPWYKQFWPWFIIALPASAVVASFVTLWIAISNPDQLIVDDDEYRRLNSELKAQAPVQENKEKETGKSESHPD